MTASPVQIDARVPGAATGSAAVPMLTLEQLHALPAAQQPDYADQAAVASAVGQLRTLPPLVFAGECDTLLDRLADVANGKAFVLQGGDCAETLAGVRADAIRNTLRTLLSMSVVLTYAGGVPVLKMGRIAGQVREAAVEGDRDPRRRRTPRLPGRRGQRVRLHP